MRKILRFTATWCMPCKALEAVIEASKVDIPIEIIDVDEHPELAKTYGIRSIPTLVVLDENIEVRKRSGLMSVDENIEVRRRSGLMSVEQFKELIT